MQNEQSPNIIGLKNIDLFLNLASSPARVNSSAAYFSHSESQSNGRFSRHILPLIESMTAKGIWLLFSGFLSLLL